MAHTITLSDEEYERLTKAAQLFAQTPHQMVSRWIAWLPQPKPPMTREEVEKLLGKPRRTSLRAASYRGSEDRLEWTYPWPNRADPERTFQVVFSSTLPGQWLVSTWQWSGY